MSKALNKKELVERKKLYIIEIQRISQLLNKKEVTEHDLLVYWKLPFRPFSFVRVFGNFTNFKKAAGLIKEKSADHYLEKRIHLKELFKEIAQRNGNNLSYKILSHELGSSYRATIACLYFYFDGLMAVCKEIGCNYNSWHSPTKTRFENYTPTNQANINKESFKKRILEIAKENNNSLSTKILASNFLLYPNTIQQKVMYLYGGFENMCKELNIVWIKGDHGMDIKELDILSDIRNLYYKNGQKINQTLYNKKGKYKMQLINDYFGSFGKACLEVNIKTDSMKEASNGK